MSIASSRSRPGRRRFLAGAFAALAVPALAACAGGRADLFARRGYDLHLAGLHHPRAITFAPDGRLFLAEAGSALRDGRITSVDASGRARVLHSGLPRYPSPYGDDEDVGLAGIEYLDGSIYGVIGQGEDDLASFLFRVDGDGTFTPLANLKHQPALGFPPQAPTPAIESESGIVLYDPNNLFDLAYHPDQDVFYVSDAGANWILAVSLDGAEVDYIAQYSRSGDHTVPTGIAVGPDRAVYHGLLSGFPYSIGSGVVSRIDAERKVSDFVLGVTMPIDVAWGPDGLLYVLEFGQGLDDGAPPGITAASGRVLRRVGDSLDVVIDGLNYPYAMAFGPSGDLWITVNSSFGDPGSGQLIRVTL